MSLVKSVRLDLSFDYLAGFIDGEGCIRLNKDKRHRGSILPQVLIGNTNREVIELIHAQFGGNTPKRRKRYSSNHAPYWVLNWNGPEAVALLERIHPFLVVKRAQAELVMRFVEFKKEFNVVAGKATESSVVTALDDFKDEMHKLNKRGT